MEGVEEKVTYKCSVCGTEWFEEKDAYECYKKCTHIAECKHTNYTVTNSFVGGRLVANCNDCGKELPDLDLDNVPLKYLGELYSKCVELDIIKL